jgi:uncharacterized OsmC-like protein
MTMNATAIMTKPNIINGINVDDLMALVSGVDANTANAATSWRVATCWKGQTHSRSKVDGFDIAGEHVARPFTIDIDEPCELGGSNRYANPQEHLIAALNACMTVGYAAQCALRGIELESLEIETTGDIDLRGFLGLNPDVAPGYESMAYTVRIKGNATPEQFEEVHAAVMATSPNFHNISKPIALSPTLIVE